MSQCCEEVTKLRAILFVFKMACARLVPLWRINKAHFT